MNRKRINIAGLDEDTVGKLRIHEPDAEFYVEHKAAAGTTGSNVREMPKPPAQAEELAPCTATPGCIGKVGHEGDCMTTLAPSPVDLGKTMEAAAARP